MSQHKAPLCGMGGLIRHRWIEISLLRPPKLSNGPATAIEQPTETVIGALLRVCTRPMRVHVVGLTAVNHNGRKAPNSLSSNGVNVRETSIYAGIETGWDLRGRTLTFWRPLLPDRVKPSFVIFFTSGHFDAQGWASECPNVKNYKWRLNPVWHRVLYSCTYNGNSGRQRVNEWPQEA